MNDLIFNTELIKGAKGDTGDTGLSYEVPTGAVIAYDGQGIPEGYVETTEPLPPTPPETPQWNSIYVSNNADYSGAQLGSDGWYSQTSDLSPILAISDTPNLTMYGKAKFKAHFHIKTLDTIDTGEKYILGTGNNQVSNRIYISNGTLYVGAVGYSYNTGVTLSADTEYIIDFAIDATNTTISYSIALVDGTILAQNTITQAIGYGSSATNWHIFSAGGGSKFWGKIYLPESYVKVDNVLIWGTEPTE